MFLVDLLLIFCDLRAPLSSTFLPLPYILVVVGPKLLHPLEYYAIPTPSPHASFYGPFDVHILWSSPKTKEPKGPRVELAFPSNHSS